MLSLLLLYKCRWTLCRYIAAMVSLHQLRAIPAARMGNTSNSGGYGVGIIRNTELCMHRPELEQHNIGGSCGCGLRGLQAARQEPQLPCAGACLLPLSASLLFSTLLEAPQTILHLIGPVLPILCLMADSMCSFSPVLSAHVGMRESSN